MKGIQSNQEDKSSRNEHIEEKYNVHLNKKFTNNEIKTFTNQSFDQDESVLDTLEEMEKNVATIDHDLVKSEEEDRLLNKNKN